MFALEFNRTHCQNIRKSLRSEWLETNGLGDYASSTIPFCNTRKYHGLLVADLDSPEGRHVLLATMDETVVGKDREFTTSCRKHPGVFYPKGWEYLENMRSAPWPRFQFRFGEYLFTREVLMPYKKRVTLIRYALHGPVLPYAPVLRLKPLLAFRHFHSLTQSNLVLNTKTFPAYQGFLVRPYNTFPPFYGQLNSAHTYFPSPDWYFNIEYLVEQERGYPCQEDLFMPVLVEALLPVGEPVIFAASTEEIHDSLDDLWEEESRRRVRRSKTVLQFKPAASRIIGHLAEAGEAFLVTNQTERSAVIAGYHWFDAWGRDSLIALPGLTFCSGRYKEGLKTLEDIARSAHNGLIPNCYRLHAEDNAYNSVDASLWFPWTVQQLQCWGRGRHNDFIREVCWPVIKDITRAYAHHPLPDVRMDESGMLHVGGPDTQLTWMDASIGGKPVTPRNGCPVEINALWYNALMYAVALGKRFNDEQPELAALAAKLKTAFKQRFWIPTRQSYLADVWRPDAVDKSVRPNQVFAAALPYSPLDLEEQACVVEKVRNSLLTPFGLRTLSPEDGQFQGRYEGGQAERDAAYHQGTVWPWLLGAYGESLLRTAWDTPGAVADLLEVITPLCTAHLYEAGIGFISEVFSGAPPYAPDGCIAQAWSVGETVRLLRLLQKAAPDVFMDWESAQLKGEMLCAYSC